MELLEIGVHGSREGWRSLMELLEIGAGEFQQVTLLRKC